LLGYGAVLVEEIIVAFVHTLGGTFTLPDFLSQVQQFWAFNILAFTGFIIAWYILTRRFSYSIRDIFIVAGVWGLFSEHIFANALSYPVAAALLVLPVMYSYFFIAAPAVVSTPVPTAKTISKPLLYVVSLAIILACSIIPVLVLQQVRERVPRIFPPCEYIPC